MAQPESGLTEEQRRRKRQLELRRKRAAAEQQKNEQNRIAARSARSGQTPDFNRPVDPAKQQGFINTALTNPLDRFQNEIKNFEPRPDAGINHPMDALLFKFGNSLTGGAFQAAGNDVAPGAELGNRAVKASDSYPVAAMTGQTGGMATQVIAGGHALAPLKGLPLVKNAVDAAGKTRLGSYAGRMAKDMGLWTGESALQGATTLASENAAYTGKEPTMGDRAAMAKDMATMNMGDLGVQMPFVKDIPLNVAGPLGTSLMRRTGTALATQGASVTPQHVRKSVQSGTGRLSGGPEQMRAVAGVIDTELAGGLRPQSIAAVHRILKHSGLTDSDIRALNTEVSERMQALPGSAASRKTVGQLYSEILEETKPQAAENIRAVLRERRLNIRRNDNSAGIIRAGTRDLRDSQKDFLDNSATTNLGTDTRIGVREQVKAAKKEIGDEYDRILDAAPVTGEGADSLRFTLKSDPRSATVLKRKAKNAGFVKRGKDGKLTVDVNAYIDANPYRAGHWMRSRLSKDARSAQGTEKGDLLDTVEEIDEVLNGFDAYAQTKSNWGSEQGVMDARTFGDKLFGGTDSKQINNDGMRAELVESFNALPEREKTVALASIRDAALARMRGGPADQQARISSITTGGAIDFFNEVGAKNFADDLLAIKQEQGYLNAFDPDAGPRTAPNQQAVSQAPALYNSKIANAVDNSTPGTVLGEGALMAFAPHYQGLYAAYRGSRLLAEMGLGTRAKTLEDMTRFLMARPQASGNLPMKNVTPTKGGSTAPPAGGSPLPMKPPPNSGTPGPDFPIVVRHEDGQEIGFKTREEAEAFVAQDNAPVAESGFIRPEMLNNPTTGGAVLGGIGGGSMAQDLDGDGRVSMQERYVQGTLGALAGGLGGRAVGKLDDQMISQGSRQVLEGRAAPSSMGISKQTNQDYFGQPLEEIFDQEAKGFSTLTDSATDGRLKVVERPDGWSSIIETYVPSESRRQGAGTRLLERALDDYPNLQGSFTSEQSIKNAFRLGMRDANNPSGSLDDALRVYASEGQVLLRSNGAKKQGSLPMDEASRMARAREIDDWPVEGYHGSASNVTQFDPSQAGRVTKSRSAKLGTWIAGNPDTANGYASYASQTRPVQDLIDASYAAERKGNWDEAHRLMQQAETLEQKMMQDGLGEGANVMPLMARGNYKKIDMEGAMYDPDDMDLTRMAREAKAEGFDGVRFQNFSDEADYGVYRPTEHTLVFDPKNIRSKYATFDPAQSESPVLTAGIGGRRGNLPMKGDAKQGGSTTTDRAVDAATLGVASGGFVGPADAEGVNYEAEFAAVEQDLQRAQGERQATLQRLQAAQDELAAWNARFNGQDRDVKAIQTFLRDNVNPDLAVDGDPRGQTATANQQYISRLEQAIIAQQEALAKNDEMVQSAEKRRADLENRQVYDQTAPNPAWDFVREKLPWVGAAAGIYAGYRTRGGTMRKARQKAEAVENQVEGLLKPSRGKNALSKDSHAVNEMHELGGSGPNVPFDDYLTGPKQGQPRARPNAAEIASLFPKASQNWSRADIAGSALWGLEGTAGTVGMMYSDANLQAAETRLRQLEDAPEKDLAAIKKARSDVEFWKSAKAISQASQMLGIYGAGINLAKGAVEKLPTPQPNKKKIADMRSSVAQRIQKRDQEHRDANR